MFCHATNVPSHACNKPYRWYDVRVAFSRQHKATRNIQHLHSCSYAGRSNMLWIHPNSLYLSCPFVSASFFLLIHTVASQAWLIDMDHRVFVPRGKGQFSHVDHFRGNKKKSRAPKGKCGCECFWEVRLSVILLMRRAHWEFVIEVDRDSSLRQTDIKIELMFTYHIMILSISKSGFYLI